MSFFTQAAPKLRQEGFAPPASPGPSPPAFDNANMFFAHHMFPNNADFGDELAAMLAPQRPTSPHQQQQQQQQHHPHAPHPPHNPFDTNSTAPYRPHNIFDVGAPQQQQQQQQHPPAPFPAHFSLPEQHSAYAAPYPDFDPHRPPSRSRSRSKQPAPTPRGRIPTKKPHRPSISSAHSPSPGRPHAILIPPPGSPLALHIQHAQTAPSAWFAPADSPFSLPTPDSVGASHFGASPRSATKDSPPPDAASKQAQLASEKRRRRRESHNAVERRRRDNINEKISELATLIPECMLDPSAGGGAGEASLDGFAGVPHADDVDDRKDAAGAVKANKGMILRKSVEYIRYLQQLVNAQATRNRELEAQLAHSPHAAAALPPPPPDDDVLVLGDEGMVMEGSSPDEGAHEADSLSLSPRGRPRDVRVKQEEDDAEDSADGEDDAKRMEE